MEVMRLCLSGICGIGVNVKGPMRAAAGSEVRAEEEGFVWAAWLLGAWEVSGSRMSVMEGEVGFERGGGSIPTVPLMPRYLSPLS